MGRNKNRSKAAAHAASESDEELEETHKAAAAATTPREDGGGAKEATAPATAGQHSGHNSDHADSDSDGDGTAKAKKKEYKGNRLKKQEKKIKTKGKGAAAAASAAEETRGEGAGDKEEAEGALADGRVPPIEVLYCPNCSFPAEYCEFGGMMEKCRPWLLEHAAELADAEDRGRKRRILTEKDRLEALLEGRGIKKALERVVVIDVGKRSGKHMNTAVFGMDLFGFNLKDLSRDWRKRFSCGGGVRSAEEGMHQDCIDIQGNVQDEVAEMLVSKYSIPKTAVFIMEGKKKVPYPY
ncbi:hypothetical protein ABB37_05278 [Leptomonas pyrrhocoris]|uniref:SUI1 domain-containing protein n=1 Tax=Leptomonas pyrrhocoris TaxID=157538 RepID=A0A0M9FZQ1_LEPPY|nr:hypothetical protein ABB37_05278 [Leptomonas pyrrhocoris]KPA79440.1 hypothetical protein ABB37_05278 [Leptomonas pyrrhocoris]|eukprot:XP_015657879.1 hypothetical protein ABB37_05278 [Leptomonas pyrrhocoris]